MLFRQTLTKSDIAGRASQCRWHRIALAIGCVASCSVYDPSLLRPEDQWLADGGGGAQPNANFAGASTQPQSSAGTGGALVNDGASAEGGTSNRSGAAGGPSAPSGDTAPAGGAGTNAIGGTASDGAGTNAIGGTASGGDPTSDRAGAGNGGAAADAASCGGVLNSKAGSAGTIELAHGKQATSSTQQKGNEPAKGNDGDQATRWCAIDGTFPQWWKVDLGSMHSMRNVAISFQHPDRKYSYVIETSRDNAVYTQRAAASGTGAVQSIDFPDNVFARYLRITVTDGEPGHGGNGVVYKTWACFFDVSVSGI